VILVPTLHPGSLAAAGQEDGQAKFEQTVIGDFRKGLRLTRELPRWNEDVLFQKDPTGRQWRIFPTPFEVEWFFQRMYAAFARHPQAVADSTLSLTVDVETSRDAPLLAQMLCIGFGFRAPDEEQVLNVPVLSQGGVRYWDTGDFDFVFDIVRRALADVRIPKTCHNKGFDVPALWAFGAPVQGWVWDTMAAHHVADGELPHNLGYVGTTFSDARFWKDDAKGDDGFAGAPDDKLRTYNCRDILTTQRVQEPLHALVKQQNLWSLYLEELEAIDIFIRGSIRGMLVDEERRMSRALDANGKPIGLAPKLEIQRDNAIAALRELAGNAAFDPAKPVQIQQLLFQKLGFPVVVTSPKTGKPKVDKEAMMLLELSAQTQEQRAALRNIISFRQAEKFLGTFIHGLGKFVHPVTWRFHTQWRLLAVSGRWTSTPNCQNWNRKVKRLFRAAPGHKLVGVDLSQAELRYIAYLAGDTELLRMYEQGINVHTANVALLFKTRCPKSDDTNPQTEAYLREMVPRLLGPGQSYDAFPYAPKDAWKTIRTLAKMFSFACNYGSEAETLFTMLRSRRDPDSNKLLFPQLMLSEVQGLRVQWTKVLHPQISAWWDAVQYTTRREGGYRCPLSGRTRWFRGGFKKNEMLNYPIQTGVASWMNRQTVKIQRKFDSDTGGAAVIVQQVHDALNVEAPDGYAHEAGRIMCDVLNEPFELNGHSARLPTDKYDLGDHLDEI
jgi:DNA polymerase I-like protein with 3'-5' exonuclease and polymerase domains